MIELMRDPQRLVAMGAAAAAYGRRDGDEALRRFMLEVMSVGDRDPGVAAVDRGAVGDGPPDRGGRSRDGWSGPAAADPGHPGDRQRAAGVADVVVAAGPGGTIHMRHEPSNLDGVDTVVYSTAIPHDHLELVEARKRGLRILHRSEALVAAMTGRRSVAVAGTHGKTTTTSMLTYVLQHAGLDPVLRDRGRDRPSCGVARTTAPASTSSSRRTRRTGRFCATTRTWASLPTSMRTTSTRTGIWTG